MRKIALFLFGYLAATSAGAQGLPPVPVPAGNPITTDKALLGKALFWDEQLSSTRTVSCGTCHIPSAGGSDPRSLTPAATHPGADGVFGTADDVVGSPGVIDSLASGRLNQDATFGLRAQVTGRKTPSMINAAFAPLLFWDGRAAGTFTDPITGGTVLGAGAALESQAAGPPVSDVEMAHSGRDWADIELRLAGVQPLALAEDLPATLQSFVAGQDYAALFDQAFGTPDVTAARTAMALATYQRTLISDQSPFDAFLAGSPGALTQQQQRGRGVFNGPGRCDLCHNGPLQTDQQFHNIGVRPPDEDLGRFEVTGQLPDRGRFKTPTLRNVGLRAPYFHNGSMATLEDVVAFYNRGGDFGDNQDPLIRPLGLGPGQRADLVAFLRVALTDPRVANGTAPFDRPTLCAESNRAPSLLGTATPGSGGFVPRMVAEEPFLVGNPSATLGIEGGLGGALGFLLMDVAPFPSGFAFLGAEMFLGLTPALVQLSVAPLQGVGAGAGWDSVSLSIPSNPALAGQSVWMQWAVLDPTPSGLLSASEAAEFPLFQ